MTLLGRSVVRTSGYEGSPGINVIHWSAGTGPGPSDPGGVDEFHATLFTALHSLEGIMPSSVTWAIEPDVPYFDDSDGVLLGVTTDPEAPRTFIGDSENWFLARDTCLCVRTRTEGFVSGRRLQGRIFIGPISADAFDTEGQIAAAIVGAVPGYFSGLISGLGGRLAVWHRPPVGNPTGGSYQDVTSITCNSVPGTIRGRKT
jgi:hypothetical protein